MPFTVSQVNWNHAKRQLRKVREQVFICECRIPKAQEFDSVDYLAKHILVSDDQSPVATARITANGEISRVAIITSHRLPEVTKFLFNELCNAARSFELEEVYIRPKLDEVDRYQKQGFECCGNVFMDAGIPHLKMKCPLSQMASLNYYDSLH